MTNPTEWKPGDVVTATVAGRPNVRVVAGWSRYDPRLRWCEMSPRWGDGDDDECWFMPHQVTDHRPLVVIDPEDREQIERLANAHADLASGFAELLDEPWTMPAMRMRQALREFAAPTPPRPDEPTGLGAVIEDNEGVLWVRVRGDYGLPEEPWRRCSSPLRGEFHRYADLAVAKVLSEGVTP